MGIGICDNRDGVAFLFCSTSGRPIQTPRFADGDEAQSFLDYCHALNVDPREDACALESLRAAWLVLPNCQQCGERVVKPGDLPNECESCRPECEAFWDDCAARGDEDVEVDGHTEHYCATHAKQARERCGDCGTLKGERCAPRCPTWGDAPRPCEL